MIEPMMKMLMGSEPVWSASKALKFGRSNNTINQNGTEADKVNSIVTSEDPKKASAISISEECDGGFSIVSFSGLDSVKGSAVDSDPNAEDAKTASCNASSSESETTEASSLNSGSMTKSEVAKETGSHENAVGDTDDWVQVTNTNESTDYLPSQNVSFFNGEPFANQLSNAVVVTATRVGAWYFGYY